MYAGCFLIKRACKREGKEVFDFFRIACAVPDLSVGDVGFNTEKIAEKLTEAEQRGACLTVFPELSLTGYTCADLFFQRTLLDGAKAGLARLVKLSGTLGTAFAVGLPLKIGDRLFNCAAFVCGGRVLGLVPKTFLPNYNEFYEKRWFSPSEALDSASVKAKDIGLDGDYDVPVGRDLIFDFDGVKVAAEVCEDLWAPVPPSTWLAIGGAEVIVNLSASNETISKRAYRRTLVSQQSARMVCAYAYCSAGECESTTDLIFSGNALICENGTVLAENKQTVASNHIVISDVDLGRLRADRMKVKTFADSADLYAHLQPTRTVPVGGCSFDSDGALYPINKLPFVPSTRADRFERCMSIFEMQVAGLKKRLAVTGCKAVIGVSGGLDSTLAILVCCEAVRRLGRPSTDVVGITMPCFGTTGRTHNNALELMRLLGVDMREINIRDACVKHCEDIGHDINKLDVTFENVQARERTQVLMDCACELGGLVVGTGDLSELALGWCTYNADHMSMYGVNASIPKTLVRWLIDSIAESEAFAACRDVLRDIIDTPISPELLPPDADGNIAQQTEDIVGPYALHDFFLYNMLRYGFGPEKIFALACRAFEKDFDRETVLKWLRTFYRRFFTQQFKRSCLPDGVKVGSICLSPRGDWRMPSDASAAMWLKAVDEIEI